MRVVFGFDRIEIRNTRDVAPDHRRALDFDSAARLLRGSMGNATEAAKMRRLLHSSTPGSLRDWSDYAVIEEIARQIASGRLCLVTAAPPRRTGGGTSSKSAPVRKAEPAAEPPPPRAAAPPPPPEPAAKPRPVRPRAPDDPGLVAQAQVLQEAAANGTPFCEECARLAAASGQQATF